MELKKLTIDVFERLLDMLINFNSSSISRGFYPTKSESGLKAVLLPEAEPKIVQEFFDAGLAKTIFLSPDLREIKEFSVKFQRAVQMFKKNVSKEKDLCLRVKSILPWLEDGKIVLEPIHVVLIQTYNKNQSFPSRLKKPEIPTYIDFLNGAKEVYKKLVEVTRQPPEGKERPPFFLNFKGEKVILLSSSKLPIKEEGVKEIRKFQGPFDKLNGIFQGLSAEIREKLCIVFLEVSVDHTCDRCEGLYEEDYPMLKGDTDEDKSSNGLDIIVE